MSKVTVQEALENLVFCKYENGKDWDATTKQTMDIAISAVEKQVAKKPNNAIKTVGGTIVIGSCPRCTKEAQREMNYCYRCGQKLDWSEEET